MKFVWKTDKGGGRGWGGLGLRGAESIALLIFVLRRCFNHRSVKGGRVGQKALFRAS